MKLFVLIFSLLFLVQVADGQDIIYTVSAEFNRNKVALDSIVVENITNGTHSAFDNLPEEEYYQINLTKNAYWGSVNATIFKTDQQVFKAVVNTPGHLSIVYQKTNPISVTISVYNLSGQQLYLFPIKSLIPNNLINIKLGKLGVYFVRLQTEFGEQTFKTVGSVDNSTNIDVTDANSTLTVASLKNGKVSIENNFTYTIGDSLNIMVYKNGRYSIHKKKVIADRESINFSLDTCYLSPKVEVSFNQTRISGQGLPSLQYIQAAFYNVSGPLHYESDGEHYMLFPGVSSWDSLIPPAPSHVLKLNYDGWKYEKRYDEALFIGPRNFEIQDNAIAIGDGNELGDIWKGDLWYADILHDGGLKWTKVNSEDKKGWFHGTCIGDLNNDGLMDVGGTPGAYYTGEERERRLNIYIQNPDGSFSQMDTLIDVGDTVTNTLDFADVYGDSRDEIITASSTGGDPSVEHGLNYIEVYKYNESRKKFEVLFSSQEPAAFYNYGMCGTSIKVSDFDNDGIKDISVAREGGGNYGDNAFEIWKGLGDGKFIAHYASPVWNQNELQFREFWVFDANLDGYQDIILRPFHYGSLYRINPVWWNPTESEGIKLNYLIWLNNGDGTFSHYSEEDLILYDVIVDNVHPYMKDGKLNFVGTGTYLKDEEHFLYDENAMILDVYNISIDLRK